MDNLLIIDDVDTCYIQQNSWLILLQKQIARNYYLFRIYEKDKSGKKSKINPKQLHLKMKCSINNHIKDKIKNRKNSEKSMYLNTHFSASVSVRRKTQEINKKSFLKIFNKNDPEIQTAGRYFTSHHLQQSFHNGQNIQESSNNSNFLPFTGTSLGIDQSKTLFKKEQKILTQKRQKMTKFLSHTKPILSLHDLELNTKQLFPSQQTNYQKRLTQIERLLIRSTMNSPKKQMNGKNNFIVKKAYEELPQIGRLDCKALAKSLYSNTNEKILHIETQHPICDKSSDEMKKTQETKQSECDQMCGLESILQYYIKSHKKNKQQVFQDHHISKSTMIKNYRISKVKNIKFPVH